MNCTIMVSDWHRDRPRKQANFRASWIAALMCIACGHDVAPEDSPPARRAAEYPPWSPLASRSNDASDPPPMAAGNDASNLAGRAGATAGRAGAAAGSGGTAAAGGAPAGAGSPVATPPMTGAAGSKAGATHAHDPCEQAEPVAAEDASIMGKPDRWIATNGEIDLALPMPILSWMDDRLFREGHDAWHAVRKCGFNRGIEGLPTSPAAMLCDNPSYVAKQQECDGTDDGYQFLVVHRHMLQVMRQAFPKHPELFVGFPKFPYAAIDVPEEWRGRWGTGWSSEIVNTAQTLEDIENQLAMFPTEGDLGQFIQCGGMASGSSSLHSAMHSKWIVNGSPVSLGNQAVNLGNYMFWQLHAWIDQIWTRYRLAKGLGADDLKLKTALADQCREMHTLANVIGPAEHNTNPDMPLPAESGFFHESVRPIFEQTCAGCHAGSSPEAGMVLGGDVSSAVIVRNLVNVMAVRGGQYKRIAPGMPQQSWLYLKASGIAATANCTGTCMAQVMPPTGKVTLTQVQLEALRKWIADGAVAPATP